MITPDDQALLRHAIAIAARATQDEARSSAGFQMTSQRWPSGSWKYPE
jgi:hypothetical protein